MTPQEKVAKMLEEVNNSIPSNTNSNAVDAGAGAGSVDAGIPPIEEYPEDVTYTSGDFEAVGEYGESGVAVHPVHSVMDGSKVKALMDCPRGFFFSHILGWQKDQFNIHLTFGSAMHAALETLYLLGDWHLGEAVVKAYEEFLQVYNEEAMRDEFFEPDLVKNPDQAMRLIINYAAVYAADLNKYKTLYTEVGGVIPITEDHTRLIHFNIDQIFQHLTGPKEGKVGYKEYKTTGRNTEAWRNSWQYAFQPGTYFYALAAHYGFENIGDCMVDGLVVRKPTKPKPNNFDFERFPIKKSGAQISAWISDANNWWDYLDWNLQKLCQQKEGDPVLHAFPMNSSSCAKFGCRNFPYCHMANPLDEVGTDPPIGYDKAFWDPRQREVVKHQLDLTKDKTEITPILAPESDD